MAYDIRDDQRLRRVHDIVRSHGDRLQYSVFLCDLSPRELLKLRWELKDVMNEAADSIAIVDLGDPAVAERTGTFEFLGIPPDLPSGGATVL